MRNKIDIINELKIFWGVKEFSFEAQYAINRKGNGFFRNLRKLSDKSKIFLPNGNQLTIGVSSKELKFEVDQNYIISVFVPNDEIRSKFDNDYTIFLDTIKSPPKAIVSQPESYVKSLEREYKSVIGIGLDSLKGAVKRISYDINRKPETFIFELLQNADDYPDKQKGKVVVSFKIVNEYLVFQHNGLPFGANNVKALCSVDDGDKEYDFEKIGYKGIGFKSIFKHSNYVLIHSGGYTFKFDENYHRSQGIDTFWQLIPIWTDLLELPESVQKQISNNFSVTIIIKPEEGNSQLRSYEDTFNSIFKDERVLLFLRHVEHFSFRGTTSTIVKRKDSNTWAISKLEPVVVPDEIKKTINEKIKVDDRIPQKYKDLEKTNLTFATQKIEGKITTTEQAHLYAYLPTDLDFGFPFLLNGDFIPDGGRHYLHADIEWNQFLFKEAGKNLLKWIVELWSFNNDWGAYDMLPDENKLVSERPGDEKDILLKCFLEGLSEAKNSIKFIATKTNELFSVQDIILDDTGIFSSGILPYSFYYDISSSNKKLPHQQINTERLFSSYLELEKFTSIQLIDLLSIEENKVNLKGIIKFLEGKKYLSFIEWFNAFCYKNNVSNEWLLNLPIVRMKEDVLCLTEALFNSQYLFKTHRTINIENIITKIGIELSEIYFEDQRYQFLYGVLRQQESYLKSDLKLYEHIAAAKELSKLTATEKNTLITFFESLDEVGKAKYAKTLALFKSKKVGDSLSPLNSLISNSCIVLPSWLNDFVIDAEEENSLSNAFQKELLLEKDFLSKLFCNSDIFSEIIKGININNVEEFYTYLLKLHGLKTEDLEIDKTIPWLFIETSLAFSKASEIYLPDSLTKLSRTKYNSIKTVIESISAENLPHFSALKIKIPFALGGNEFELGKLQPKENLLDVGAVNDFLDWSENNGEKELLNHLLFIREVDKFSIGNASGILSYYTTDNDLIKLIEASNANTKLTQFPSELYTRDRSKIGLLEGNSLLKYLLDEGYQSIDLVRYIQVVNDTELKTQFLENLVGLNISTSKSYISDDDEFRILKLVIQHIVPEKEKLKSFKSKITIDGQPLLERAISEDIYFYDKNVKLITKLSDILPNYKNRTFPLSEIIEKFEKFDDNKNLIAILKDEGRSPKKILKELNEQNPSYFNAAQTLFLSFYQSLYPEELVLKDKIFFTTDLDKNRDLYEKEVGRFFEYCILEDNYIGFVEQEIIVGFKPKYLIANDKYAIELERLPCWLKEWLNEEEEEQKKLFLEKLEINGIESHIVQLRKGLTGDKTVNMDAARGGINDPELLKNTFEWLLEKFPNLEYNSTILKPLYERANVLNIPVNEIPLPLPLGIDGTSYSIQKPFENAEFHLVWDGWRDFKSEIWDFLKNKKCLVLDNILPEKYLEKLAPLKLAVEININKEELKHRLRDFNAWFYKHWEGKDNCIIKIYQGDKLPHVVVYNNQTIKNFYDGFSVMIDDEYIVSESIESSIPHSIKDLIPGYFHQLNSWKSDFENNRTERRLTPEEEEAILKLFDGVVPEELRKNQNLSALASALVYFDEKGFDVKKANKALISTHEYAQLSPVYKDGQEFTIMCRSARLGLLYLTKQAWDRLDQPHVMLFVDTGFNEPELFKNKQDVLDVNIDNPTDFQLMRIESRANAKDLDQMLRGKFEDATRLWIILRLKGNEHFDKLFFERPETNNNSSNSVNVKTDDDGGY